MSFYLKWLENKNTDKENEFIEKFLCYDREAVEVFYSGSDGEIGTAISVIISTPLEKYISILDNMNTDYEVSSGQIPQFSDFSKGMDRVPELLLFAPEGLNYEELGYQLVKAGNKVARVKYGENHAKLAAIANLVQIEGRPAVAKVSCLGKYIVTISKEEREALFQRMILRNRVVLKIISESKRGIVKYKDIAKNLSGATAKRRRSNVYELVSYVLNETTQTSRLDNIDWSIDI